MLTFIIWCVLIVVVRGGNINQDHLDFFSSDTNGQIKVNRKEEKRTCEIIFPGTSTLMDWMKNVDFGGETIEMICPEESPEIHNYHPLLLHLTKGYLKRWLELKFDPERLVDECQGLDTLRFGGFSMGGSLATIAAIQVSYLIHKCHHLPSLLSKKIELVSLGSPRIFDKETVEYLLEARHEFDLIKKTRYCLYDDWVCHFFFSDQGYDYVHWGTAVTDIPDGEGHTHSIVWNWPRDDSNDKRNVVETSKMFANFAFSFFPEFIEKEFLNVNMDLSKVRKGTLRHLEYASLFDGIEECPYSAENCTQKEREDPQCMQFYTKLTLLEICEKTK